MKVSTEYLWIKFSILKTHCLFITDFLLVSIKNLFPLPHVLSKSLLFLVLLLITNKTVLLDLSEFQINLPPRGMRNVPQGLYRANRSHTFFCILSKRSKGRLQIRFLDLRIFFLTNVASRLDAQRARSLLGICSRTSYPSTLECKARCI